MSKSGLDPFTKNFIRGLCIFFGICGIATGMWFIGIPILLCAFWDFK